MWYINKTPNDAGNYGNPMGQQFPDSLVLPAYLLGDYVDAKGFVFPVVENDTVTELAVNQEALDAYLVEHPDVAPEPEQTGSFEEQLTAAVEKGLSA